VSKKKAEQFEEALKKLQMIVERLERGDLPLEQAMESFTEGMQLVQFCHNKLQEAEKKVEVLMQNQQQEWKTSPFEPSTGDLAEDNAAKS
jgi:exodeoxyribonuclease VII small subunit